MNYYPYLTLPKKIKLDNMLYLYVFHTNEYIESNCGVGVHRLYVYEWVYVEADREDGYFCEPQTELASTGLKGKNCTLFSVSLWSISKYLRKELTNILRSFKNIAKNNFYLIYIQLQERKFQQADMSYQVHGRAPRRMWLN